MAVSSSSPSRRSVFAIGNSFRFQMRRRRLGDALLDGCQWMIESVVYLLGPLLIGLALSIVGLLVYVYTFILLSMLSLQYTSSIVLLLSSLWVIFLLINVLWNYFFCITTRNNHNSPQYQKVVQELAAATDFRYPITPAQCQNWKQEFESLMVQRIQAASGTRTRSWMLLGPFEWGYCPHSQLAKPPRSHYDHVTQSLVLNLDHYCPWMFNAIGYFNYRYFLNFLLYIFLGMLYGVVLLWQPFMLLQTDDYRKQVRLDRQQHQHEQQRLQPMMPHADEKFLVTLSFMLCAAVGCAVLILGGFHLYLLLTAQTTIEFHANWAKRKTKFKNPYSQGWRLNCRQVYSSWWGLLPTTRPPAYLPVPIPGTSTLIGAPREEERELLMDDRIV